WKLALDVRGRAHPDLLDSYSAERQAVGQAVVSRTRQRSLSLAARSASDADELREDSQLYANYRGSRWVGENLSRPGALDGGPQPGERAPDAAGLRREGLEFPLRLFDLFRGTHHTLLVYGATPADQAGLEAFRQRWGDHLKT